MSTKNNPGAFDCYANAEPDEPMFVLLGRDRHAAALVNLWAAMRSLEGVTDVAKIDEAENTAAAMFAWRCRTQPDARLNHAGIRALAAGIAAVAEMHGVCLEIGRQSLKPLRQGNHVPTVSMWLRHAPGPAYVVEPPGA